MTRQFIVYFGIFFLIYAGVCYYTGLRFLQSLLSFVYINPIEFWLMYSLLSATPMMSRWSSTYWKGLISIQLNIISAYWLGIIFYSFFLWLLADSIYFLGDRLSLLPAVFTSNRSFWGIAIFTLLVILMVWGSYNAQKPVIKRYKVRIDKKAGGLEKIRAVLVSDIHLGPIIGTRRLQNMVNTINEIDPNIIFFAGDTIDEDVLFFAKQQMPEILQKLKPELGSYAVLGNHEYLGGQFESSIHYLEKSGITVLRDNMIKIKDVLYIAGRDDSTVQRMIGKARKSLGVVLDGVDPALPLIMIDHQPYDLNAAKDLGVDLMLAGHTHRGQFFPNNLITSRVFEIDWGYLKKGNLQVVVSCGYGTWGPPIRIGNSPELVEIEISFSAN